MANNHSVQILRGINNTIATTTEKLAAGQPVFNSEKNYVSIGTDSNGAINKLPITTNQIDGITEDSTAISTTALADGHRYRIYPEDINTLTLDAPTSNGNVGDIKLNGGNIKLNGNTELNGNVKVNVDSESSDLSDHIITAISITEGDIQ